MPEICRFYGIVIKLYFDDHNPPHFHAEYAEKEVVINIRTLAVIGGGLPPRAMGLAMEWALLHQSELEKAWEQIRQQQPPMKINPLP